MGILLDLLLIVIQAGIFVTGIIGCYQMSASAGVKLVAAIFMTCISLVAILTYLGIWRVPFQRFSLDEGVTYTLLSGFLLVFIVDRLPKTKK